MTPHDAGTALPVSVKVWGNFACFTRPEFGVERVSYPTMTPTAAVGVLDAIFWKPQFRWRVVAIDVLKPVRWMQLRRNEIQSRQTANVAKRWAEGDDGGLDIASDRTQRSTLLLTDVAYVIHAQAEVQPGIEDGPAKYRDQFRRRVNRGQCHERPYLGCREFVADFAPADGDHPITWTEDLGLMVHSVYAGNTERAKRANVEPIFFAARIADGRLAIPPLPEGRR